MNKGADPNYNKALFVKAALELANNKKAGPTGWIAPARQCTGWICTGPAAVEADSECKKLCPAIMPSTSHGKH
jgi:hypothetical protein